MREIKFRAWNGTAMEYGGFSIHATGQVSRDTSLSDVGPDSPIMQYTGLKDKNGKEIYEGDILSSGCEVGSIKHGEFTDTSSGEECFGFYIKLSVGLGFGMLTASSGEIIGNIYTDKELLG